jgi:hypothetical protein
MANDNNKKATAAEVTRLADAIFNKCSAISGQSDRETIVRLLGELGGIVNRAKACPRSRSKDANELLARVIVRARETVRHQLA